MNMLSICKLLISLGHFPHGFCKTLVMSSFFQPSFTLSLMIILALILAEFICSNRDTFQIDVFSFFILQTQFCSDKF